jgi:hypothetical protein
MAYPLNFVKNPRKSAQSVAYVGCMRRYIAPATSVFPTSLRVMQEQLPSSNFFINQN